MAVEEEAVVVMVEVEGEEAMAEEDVVAAVEVAAAMEEVATEEDVVVEAVAGEEEDIRYIIRHSFLSK